MKKKYSVLLVLIGFMLLLIAGFGTGYGVYLSTHQLTDKSASTINCFKVYFSNGEIIELKNIDPVVNSEGLESSPYTLTITNICREEKELQVRLNTLKDTTVDTGSLTLKASGDIEQPTILYKNLKTTKTSDNNVAKSKIIGKINIKPNQTIRTNIKLWFDEKKAPTIEKNALFKARFELIDTESSLKNSLYETILSDASEIDKKGNPSFEDASYKEDGLYMMKTAEGNNYYYRGVVTNNYIKFGNYTWRIVGVNPDKSIKIITEKSAGVRPFSKYTNNINYTGVRYTYYQQMINNDSTNSLENWYKNNIINKGLEKYVVTSKYCNDSTNYTEDFVMYFNSYKRVAVDKNPSLTCPTTTAGFGGLYERKIGLLSVDEVALAGGVYGINNQHYYLYNGENFFTQSGSFFQNNTAQMFIVTNNGAISSAATNTSLGLRPVINIDGSIIVSGTGTIDNPYQIIENQE